MALIQCPSCNKRISSLVKTCPHCAQKNSAENESLNKITHIKRSNQLMNQSFFAMTLFIAGVVIWFWGGEPAEGMRANIAAICSVFGFTGYLIARVRIVLHKRKSV
ncbi:zinc ribbon domain-containing protein [Shewanella sp. Isolate11]|uniref:zinc ribbon domain-containing protein n=1 Tax=Shewanella sp. Isolate11 TaxID=2908530 RepID=UPI001EFEE6B9|nr:zinc ribbon domain-containing protein [Shewanella sp. Isolate11]MCG9696719.1 zinc ribbon domain-containing protein [Shewanella sp. Isolate11]